MALKTNKSTLKDLLTAFFMLTALTASVAQGVDIEAILKREMKERGIPGLQVAVVQRGKIVLLKSYGIANVQDSIAVNNQTIFPINSCTKAFTGIAIMQLVEEEKVELSAPISRYVDGLPDHWQPITIRQLLTHISGLPDINNIFNSSTGGFGELHNEAAAWEKVKAMPMQFTTGTQFSYNQTNYALLGKVIDKLSGKPFATVFDQRQFQVVGMSNTVFGDSRDVIPHIAPTYSYKNNADGHALDKPTLMCNYAETPDFKRTCSGLNSTAEDMANWIIALQQGKLLKTKAALDTMWTAGSYSNGTPTQWALGWGFTKFRTKHRAVGMTGGRRSAFLVYPDDDLAIVVLTNLLGGSPDDFIEELAGCYNPAIAAADPITILRTKLRVQGFEKAIDVVKEEKKRNPAFNPNENDLNDWGYRMMTNGQDKEAMEIFKLNVYLYPESWNAYDSYGESLLKNGQKAEAVKMYTKSVNLNPDNKGGKKVLERILR